MLDKRPPNGQETAGAIADEFATAHDDADALFASEFATARDRARGLESLAAGCATLLDAREHAATGEAHLLDEAYEDAEAKFRTGAATSRDAAAVFADGDETAGKLAPDAFARAHRRAAAIEALNDGYQ